ncbi:MAG: transposase family protein [Microcoleaceae cyanobacterium]
MTLEYLREYRTYFHIGQSWGLNESTVYRITTKIENILIKSLTFKLPGKKQLLKSNNEINVVVVDVTENSIECPKKSAPPAPRFPGAQRRSKHRKSSTVAKAMQRGLGGFPHERLHQERKSTH